MKCIELKEEYVRKETVNHFSIRYISMNFIIPDHLAGMKQQNCFNSNWFL
jgi:hypothetical protein